MANDNTNADNIIPGSWAEDEALQAPGDYTAVDKDERADYTVVQNDDTPDDPVQNPLEQEDLRRKSITQDSDDPKLDGHDQETSSEALPTKCTLHCLADRSSRRFKSIQHYCTLLWSFLLSIHPQS